MREPVTGQILAGKYEVRGVLGRGGMGLVVSAWHTELGQKVAIKYLLPEALLNQEVVERFAREARAAAKVRGEHVVRILDVGKLDDGTPFFVMEHLEGHDLAVELAQRGRLDVATSVRCILQACEALAQAHAARIVHRDLKPSNLFLAETPGRRPIIKVLDFGISKFVDPSSDALTKTAAVIGTAHYMSPEQLLAAKSVDERSDLWSLGIILHQLLVGQPPFIGESAPEIIAKIIKNAPAPPRSLRDDIPAGLEAVILRCLRTDPVDRFAHVGELATALLPFAAPEDAGSVEAIARVRAAGPTTSTASMDRIDPQLLPTMTAPAATPLEIASTISESTQPPARSGRRWVGVAVVAAGLAGLGALLAFPLHRGAPAPVDAAAATGQLADTPVSALDAAVMAPPILSSPPAVPSVIAVVDASPAPPPRVAPAPRPRPVASAPATSAPRPSPSAAPSSSAGVDPLDIPLR